MITIKAWVLIVMTSSDVYSGYDLDYSVVGQYGNERSCEVARSFLVRSAKQIKGGSYFDIKSDCILVDVIEPTPAKGEE